MINHDELELCCRRQMHDILGAVRPDKQSLMEFEVTANKKQVKKQGLLAWKNNGASVLAVAHLDTVSQDTDYAIGTNVTFAGTLDDRLGVYAMIHHLPSMGINMDWLFTDLEEEGLSTAFYYDMLKIDKQYNWIVQFDRGGTDVVAYQYIDEQLYRRLSSVGFHADIGSYTDICEMEGVGIKAFNVGVGYYDAHSFNGYFNMIEFEQAMQNFAHFYEEFHTTLMPHESVGGWNSRAVAGNFKFWNKLRDDMRKGKLNIWEVNNLVRLARKWNVLSENGSRSSNEK